MIPWRRAWQPTPVFILAWRIPQTEEPGGLRSIRLQRAGRDWSDLACNEDQSELGPERALGERSWGRSVFRCSLSGLEWETLVCIRDQQADQKSFFSHLYCILVATQGIFDLRCSMRTLTCKIRGLIPWPGMEPGPPTLGAWSLSHWATREAPRSWALNTLGLPNPPNLCRCPAWFYPDPTHVPSHFHPRQP